MLTGFEFDLIIKLIVAAFLGGLIGLERHVHRRPGGLRTHALICMGSALFTLVSVNFPITNPLLAAGIVTGSGFLGAGIVFRADEKIRGLTTAAEIWVLAAIGIAIGIGLFTAAFATTVLVLIVLGPMKKLEDRLPPKRRRR